MLPDEMISTAGGPIKESARQRWGGSVLLDMLAISSVLWFTHCGEAHMFVSEELVLRPESSDFMNSVVDGGMKYMMIDNGDWGVGVCG
jgi:hypothetical protein